MQYRQKKSTISHQSSSSARIVGKGEGNSKVIDDNRPQSAVTMQKKGNGATGKTDPRGGIIQGVWYDRDGNKYKGNPPPGYELVRTTHGDYWEPPPEPDSEESSGEYENSDDSDYKEKEKSAKNKKKDPQSGIKSGTYKKSAKSLKYETESGIAHEEEYDPTNKKQTTESTGLKFTSQYRNPAHREDGTFKVYNPYGLSVGQQGQNQMVVSHNTPSWSGMQAGKEFGNSSLTSAKYNSEIEQKEKDFRSLVETSNTPFSYKTETEYEDILSDDASDIEKEIAKLYKQSKWDKKRVKKRIRKVKSKYPKSQRIKSERRTISYGKKSSTFSKKRDLLAYMPARAINKEAHRKYKEARGQDSEGSDMELEEKPVKKSKKSPKKKK